VETIILRNGLKREIMSDLQLFLQSDEWYKCRDIPYTRGYLFYGPPGTGKTSMIKGISTHCKRHIHYLVLSDVKDDNELIELMKQINYKDTILVIEDIDCTVNAIKERTLIASASASSSASIDKVLEHIDNLEQRLSPKHEKKQTTLTLSCLLNTIDGFFNNDGRILIMTTNHPEMLDGALIRPGRIDRKFCFDNCDQQQVGELYEMFFDLKCAPEQLMSIGNTEYSPAYISGIFQRYRNAPTQALLHLDKREDQPIIVPLR
jgi:SpoVK/Ycf46/Vps4 family AAA+-type ATPase